MKKLKSFLIGIILLGITIVMIVLTALIYRANERTNVKSYIFQISNFASQRVGYLQDINNMPADDLRNKLIQKYVSEYFKVIPGDTDVLNRPILKDLSTKEVYEKWQNTEAKTISKRSEGKMFRMVWVPDTGIEPLNKPENYNYYNSVWALPVYYRVNYETTTWTESNYMGTKPVDEHGTIYIEARFKPGIDSNKNIKKELESGKDPVGLFMFEVTNVGNKGL